MNGGYGSHRGRRAAPKGLAIDVAEYANRAPFCAIGKLVRFPLSFPAGFSTVSAIHPQRAGKISLIGENVGQSPVEYQ